MPDKPQARVQPVQKPANRPPGTPAPLTQARQGDKMARDRKPRERPEQPQERKPERQAPPATAAKQHKPQEAKPRSQQATNPRPDGRPGNAGKSAPTKRPDGQRRPQRPPGERHAPDKTRVATVKPAPDKVEEPEETLLQYSVHQLSQRPVTAAVVIGAIIAVAALAYASYPNALFGAVAVAVLVFSVSAFLFPIRYRFTNKGVYFRNFFSSERREWGKFYDYFIFKDAVLLSFDYRTLRGRVQKGILVYFDKGQQHKDRLLEIVSANIKRPPRAPKSAEAEVRSRSLLSRLIPRKQADATERETAASREIDNGRAAVPTKEPPSRGE